MSNYKDFECTEEYNSFPNCSFPVWLNTLDYWALPKSFRLIGDSVPPYVGTRYLIPAEPTALPMIPALRFSTTINKKFPVGLLQTEYTDGYLATKNLQKFSVLCEVKERWAADLWKRGRHYYVHTSEYDHTTDIEGDVYIETREAGKAIIVLGLEYCPLPVPITFSSTSYQYVDEPFAFPKLAMPKLLSYELIIPLMKIAYEHWKEDSSLSFYAWSKELSEAHVCYLGEDRLRQLLIKAGIHAVRPRTKKSSNQ